MAQFPSLAALCALLAVLLVFYSSATSAAAAPYPPAQCAPLPARSPPATIWDLHPNDIQVVMALGDSITAAFGLEGWDTFCPLCEFRGQSAFIGGNADVLALGAIFRQFNPAVVGASLGEHFVELPGWKYHPEQDQLNGAQSEAKSGDLPFQLAYIVQQLQQNPAVDMQTGWKFLNILIGANDACPLCSHTPPPSVAAAADEYEANIQRVLGDIRGNLTRVFVNILPMFNVSQVWNVTEPHEYCKEAHRLFKSECDCAFSGNASGRQYMDEVLMAYDARLQLIQQEWAAKNYSDFAVVLQPFTRELIIPSIDYISDLDCFHPSRLAHEAFAVATWNSLLLPAAQKPLHFDPAHTTFACPTPDDLLFTN